MWGEGFALVLRIQQPVLVSSAGDISGLNEAIIQKAAARGQAAAGDQPLSVGGIDVEARDRERRLLVGQRLPGVAAIGGGPYAAVRRSDVDSVCVDRVSDNHLYRASNASLQRWARDVAALHHRYRPNAWAWTLQVEDLIDLNLRNAGGRQQQRCRDDEPAQSPEHETPPIAHDLTSSRLQ